MAVIKINDFKGIYSNIDEQDANIGQLKDCVNFDLDVPGKLVKRKSLNKNFYSPSAGYPIRSLYRFVDDNLGGGASWVALCPHVFGYNTKIYSSDDDGATWTELYDIGSDIFNTSNSANFLVIGDALYISVDAVINHVKYQYIDRKYFWNSTFLTFTGWNADNGIPTDIGSIIINETESSVSPYGVTKNMPIGNYFWYLTYLYDGLQESLLSENGNAFNFSYILLVSNALLQLECEIPVNTFNKRITSMNLYRKTTGTYSKVQNIGTTSKDPNLMYSEKAYCGDFIHLSGGANLVPNELMMYQFSGDVASITAPYTDIPTLGTKLTTANWLEAYVFALNYSGSGNNFDFMLRGWNGLGGIGPTDSIASSTTPNIIATSTFGPATDDKLYNYNSTMDKVEIKNHNSDAFFCDPSDEIEYVSQEGEIFTVGQSSGYGANKWFLTTDNMYNPLAGWSFGVDDQSDWVSTGSHSLTAISRDGTYYMANSVDNYSLKHQINFPTAYRDNEIGTSALHYGPGKLQASSWYVCSLWVLGNYIDTINISINEYNGATLLNTTKVVDACTDWQNVGTATGATWRAFNVAFYTTDWITVPGATYKLRVGGSDTNNGYFYIDNVYIARIATMKNTATGGNFDSDKRPETELYGMGGTQFVYGEDLNFDKANLYDGWRMIYGDNSATIGTDFELAHINGSTINGIPEDFRSNKCIAFHGTIPSTARGGPHKFYFNQNYLWYKDTDTPADHVKLSLWDNNLTEKGPHPYAGTSSIDVKYKFSKYIKGRLFCANVTITSGENVETHRDWIMYSEISQPDFIPVSNYIELEDLEGGEITGMESLEDYVVVFKTQGVFLLYVPRSDPGSWNLDESRLNIGCVSPESITKTPYGLFWASQKGIYMMQNDGGIVSAPITFPIADLYLGSKNQDKVSGSYFPEKDSIIFSFTTSKFTGQKAYLLDLKSISSTPKWSSYEWGDWTTGNEPPWSDDGMPT